MGTPQKQEQTRTPWYLGSIVILFFINCGTITYTITVTRQLSTSITNLREEMEAGREQLNRMFDKRITWLEQNYIQQPLNVMHGDKHGEIQRILKKRGIRSVTDNTDVWKMMRSLTARSNNTVIMSVLIGGGIKLTGPRGKPGPRGKSGPIGPKGAKGDQGMNGSKGQKGDRGDFGQKGDKGERGLKGEKGDSIEIPRIVVQPVNQTVLEGNVAAFVCEAIGNPSPVVKVTRNNKTMDGRYRRLGEGMLEIINVTKEDEGDIICSARSVLGEDRKKAKLTVLVKANADIPEEIIEGEEGYDIAIPCKVEGVPLPKITWYRSATSLPTNAEHNRITNTLVIKNATRGDGGQYICNAENYLRNSTDAVNVQIKKKLSFLFKTANSIETLTLDYIRIYCLYENGVQPINVTWLKDNKKVQSGVRLFQENQVLSISSIDKDDAGSYKCIVQSKYSTLLHETRVFVAIPKTCNDIRRLGRRQSKFYTIYPLNGRPAVVYCDMTSKSYKGVTVISHDSESRTPVKGLEDPGRYKRILTYNTPMQLIKAIIAVSSSCEQYIKYECSGSVIFSGNTQFAWWVSSSGQKMNNWGGVDHTKAGCSCSLTGSCSTKQKCNCDANDDGVWREDSGFLKEKEYLPITEVRFGDTGDSTEEGYHTIGKLRCY